MSKRNIRILGFTVGIVGLVTLWEPIVMGSRNFVLIVVGVVLVGVGIILMRASSGMSR